MTRERNYIGLRGFTYFPTGCFDDVCLLGIWQVRNIYICAPEGGGQSISQHTQLGQPFVFQCLFVCASVLWNVHTQQLVFESFNPQKSKLLVCVLNECLAWFRSKWNAIFNTVAMWVKDNLHSCLDCLTLILSAAISIFAECAVTSKAEAW